MLQEKYKQNTNTVTKCKCTVKKEVLPPVYETGEKTFGATLEARPCWLSFYHNILTKMETQLSTLRMMLISILVELLRSSNVKKMLLYFQNAHTYTILYLLKKEIGKIFMKADSKKHETQTLVNIIKVVERSSRYLFYF